MFVYVYVSMIGKDQVATRNIIEQSVYIYMYDSPKANYLRQKPYIFFVVVELL